MRWREREVILHSEKRCSTNSIFLLQQQPKKPKKRDMLPKRETTDRRFFKKRKEKTKESLKPAEHRNSGKSLSRKNVFFPIFNIFFFADFFSSAQMAKEQNASHYNNLMKLS